MKTREIAYLALLASLREEAYLQDSLNRWMAEHTPSAKDAALAREIAYGAAKRALCLDYIADTLNQGKLSLKRKERALLCTALYQHYFMDRVPDYAIVNESVELAKKYCSDYFAKFLNALLRKMRPVDLPDDESIRLSYPPYFVQKLIEERGREQAAQILEIGNQNPVWMARKRNEQRMVVLGDVQEVAHSPEYYIQNETPLCLIERLRSGKPKTILDLCASPGGKLICLHDFYPEAKLFANDVSDKKIDRLKENLQKYGVTASLSVGPGEEYRSEEKFDIILLDVPCSNSGVLRKRPEARWRLHEKELKALHLQQQKLFEHALKLQPGEIWYMTCSVLKEENEWFIEEMARKHSLTVRAMHTILPTREGLDGGFCAAI